MDGVKRPHVARHLAVGPPPAAPVAKRFKGGVADGFAGQEWGEVRFDSPEAAEAAVRYGHGSIIWDTTLHVEPDQNSKDGTRVIVRNLPEGLGWQELKDLFSQVGKVEFAVLGSQKGEHRVGGRAVGGGGGGGGGGCLGEVRYAAAEHASLALRILNGSVIGEGSGGDPNAGGPRIWIQADPSSKDGTKLLVHGLPPGLQWQELKDHFSQIGQVAFAGIVSVPQNQSPMPQPTTAHQARQQAMQFAMQPSFAARPGMHGMPIAAQQANEQAMQFAMQPSFAARPGMHGMKGMQAGPGAVAGSSPVGEVRYDHPAHAQQAIIMLNGAVVRGSRISVQNDPNSPDGAKVSVCGVPPDCRWQELKSLFGTVGQVAFVAIHQKGPQQAQQLMMQQRFPQQQLQHGALPSGPKAKKRPPTGPQQAEVRFATAAGAEAACAHLTGSTIQGSVITVQADPRSQDASKVIVSNVPPTATWQQVKDHCLLAGEVAFAGMVNPAEVRYENPETAQAAIAQLDGSTLEGALISVSPDPLSHDGAKLVVENLPPTMSWHEVKDYFATIGPVAYVARPSPN